MEDQSEIDSAPLRSCKKGHISLSIKVDSYLRASPGQIIIGRVRYINSEIVFIKDSFVSLHLRDIQDFLHMLTELTAALASNKECQTSEKEFGDSKYFGRIQGYKAIIVQKLDNSENTVLQLKLQDIPYFFDCIHKVIPIVVTQEETQLKCFHILKHVVNKIRKEKYKEKDSFQKVLNLLHPKNQNQSFSSESGQLAEEICLEVMKEMNIKSPNEIAYMREFMRVNWTHLYLYYHFWFKAYVK